MKLEYISKTQEYDASGSPSHTKVILGNPDGAVYPVFLPPDKIDLSNSELLDLALDKIYQDNFPMRAENEKFNVLEDKIRQFDTLMEESRKQFVELMGKLDKSEQERNKQFALLNGSFTELMIDYYSSKEVSEEDEFDTELETHDDNGDDGVTVDAKSEQEA